MTRKERRFLGDLDAAADRQFEQHFVESLDLARIQSAHSDIVYGSKGVGKTALRRALTELHRSSFYHTKTIDLDQISFAQVHEALSDLRDTTKTEVATLARNTWRNVLAMYCLETIAEKLPERHHLRRGIDQVLAHEEFAGKDSNDRLIGQIERLFLLVADAGSEAANPGPLGLSRRQLSIINEFPTNPEVRRLLQEGSKLVADAGQVALICLDGFDSIVDHSPESRRAIFAGLIDAIHKSSRDALISNAFCFKAFLPQELTDTAQAMVWDSDKFIQHTHYLRWSQSDFERFLQRRMLPFAKTRSNQFADVWHDCMPDKIRNETYRIDEPSFSYVLRHTLYRPRQLLAHLQRILDRWDEISDSSKVDPTFIPPIVAKTNYDLASSVVNQLEITLPGLDAFLQSWSGSPNVMPASQLQERIRRVFEGTQTNAVFNALYTAGVFGIAQKGPSNLNKGGQLRCRFSFASERTSPNIAAAVDGADMLALSPMFHEYCGCAASDVGAVVPLS